MAVDHIEDGYRLIDGAIINAIIDEISSSGLNTISIVNANGISGSAAYVGTNAALTLALGAITPTSVVASGNISAANLSGTNTGDQTIVLTGAVSGAGTGSITTSYSGVVPPDKGGTGIANNASSTLTINGSFGTTLTVTGATSVTLPTTGTLATLAGSETFTNKTLTSPVLNGAVSGTAVSTTSSASTLVLRDANQNAFANNFVSKATNVVSAAGTTVLTAASTRIQQLTGTSNQTFQMPDATTLTVGSTWYFNNNSTGTLTVKDAGGNTILTIPAGGQAQVIAIAVVTTNGAWDYHFLLPSNASYGTAGLTVTGAITATSNINYTGQSYGNVQTLTDGVTINWNMNNGGIATVTLGGSRTMAAPTNIKAGATYALMAIQDATGSRTITWNSAFKWPGGTVPTLSTAAGAKDIITFISFDGTTLDGVAQTAFA